MHVGTCVSECVCVWREGTKEYALNLQAFIKPLFEVLKQNVFLLICWLRVYKNTVT